MKDIEINWHIPGFSLEEKFIQSDKFRYSDFNFFVGVRTNLPGDYLCIVLFAEALENKSAHISAQFAISVVNHKTESKTICRSFEKLYSTTSGFGEDKFIQQSLLTESQGYLKNNTLLINTRIRFKGIQWDTYRKTTTIRPPFETQFK